jgi:maleate isomerase
MLREVAQAGPQCIVTYCTNMRVMRLVDRLERDTGIPIYDSIATTVWKSLRIAGVDTRRVEGWGSLFREAL